MRLLKPTCDPVPSACPSRVGSQISHSDGTSAHTQVYWPSRERRSSSTLQTVLPAGLKPTVQQRFDRLEAVWNQARLGIGDSGEPQREADFDVVTEPSRTARTPPTPEEVEAIRTARASGESVRSIAERFDKHRSTVWRYTKDNR